MPPSTRVEEGFLKPHRGLPRYLLYHLVTAVYYLARTGLPVAVDNVKNANADVRRQIAERYRVVDRRKAKAR